MNTQYTAGPWHIDPFDGKILGPRSGASSPIIAQMPVWWPHKLPNEHVSQDLQTANARLIAAAPELLEACKDIWQALDEWATERDPTLEEIADLREQAKTAISKATNP